MKQTIKKNIYRALSAIGGAIIFGKIGWFFASTCGDCNVPGTLCDCSFQNLSGSFIGIIAGLVLGLIIFKIFYKSPNLK